MHSAGTPLQTDPFHLWKLASEKARDATCSIRYRLPRASGSEFPGYGNATGTLVDRERRLVLTAKHVVKDGLAEVSCVFKHNTEYSLQLVFSDPCHDFALLQISQCDSDPQYQQLPASLPLNPDGVTPDCEVRTISNSFSYGLTTATANVGLLNCNPPGGREGPLDANIEYMALLSTTGPGSSGGLMFNMHGEAVAMTCSGCKTSSLLMPLYQPQKALKHIQANQTVPRGTLQVEWRLQPHYTCEAMGLPSEHTRSLKNSGFSNCIVASTVLPLGPVSGNIDCGDILLEMDGVEVKSLLQVEQYMDDRVDQSIKLKIWKPQEKEYTIVSCEVQNLYDLNPKHIFCQGFTVFHPIPLLTAFRYNEPIHGVRTAVLAEAPFRPNATIYAVNDIVVEDVQHLITIFSKHTGVLRISHKPIGCRGDPEISIGHFLTNNQDGAVDLVMKRDNGGPWRASPIDRMAPLPSNQPVSTLSRPNYSLSRSPNDKKSNLGTKDHDISLAIVDIKFAHLAEIDHINTEVPEPQHGLVCEASEGLVIAPRGNLTPLTRVVVTTFDGTEFEASVIYLHPALDLSVLRLNVSTACSSMLHAFSLSEATQTLMQKPALTSFIPFADPTSRFETKTRLVHIEPREATDPESLSFKAFKQAVPHFDDPLPEPLRSGAHYDRDNKLLALQTPSGQCIMADQLGCILHSVLKREQRTMRFRDFDVITCSSARARHLKLDKIRSSLPILEVAQVPLQTPKEKAHPLRKGDLILQMDGHAVHNPEDLGYHYLSSEDVLHLQIFRAGTEISIDVPTIPYDHLVVEEAVALSGLILQKPSLALLMNGLPRTSGVCVACIKLGSYADQVGMGYGVYLICIDNYKVSELTDLLQYLAKTRSQEGWRITVKDIYGRERVFFLKRDNLWPLMHWNIGPDGELQGKKMVSG